MTITRWEPMSWVSIYEDAEGSLMQYHDHALPWTSATPTSEGAFWVRDRRLLVPTLVHVIGDSPEMLVGSSDMWEGQYMPLHWYGDHGYSEWCGPLYNPEAAT